MMAEPFGGAAGTGFLPEEWLDRWMKDWIKGWMDGQDIGGGKKALIQLTLDDVVRTPTYRYSLQEV